MCVEFHPRFAVQTPVSATIPAGSRRGTTYKAEPLIVWRLDLRALLNWQINCDSIQFQMKKAIRTNLEA